MSVNINAGPYRPIRKIKCPNCDGVGKLLDVSKINIHLPRTHPTQCGETCPVCNGARTIEAR